MSLTRDDSTRLDYVARTRSRPVDSVIARLAQGDPVAARECIDEFGGLIWSIARRLTCSPADAENAVQEIFADLWRTAARFDPAQGSERVFVATIARRRLIDRMRRAHQERTQPADTRPLQWAAGMEPCPEAQAAARAIRQLRPELQRVLELGILRGLSHSEIAEVLQLPVERVKKMMHRGLVQVREMMAVAAR